MWCCFIIRECDLDAKSEARGSWSHDSFDWINPIERVHLPNKKDRTIKNCGLNKFCSRHLKRKRGLMTSSFLIYVSTIFGAFFLSLVGKCSIFLNRACQSVYLVYIRRLTLQFQETNYTMSHFVVPCASKCEEEILCRIGTSIAVRQFFPYMITYVAARSRAFRGIGANAKFPHTSQNL